jgi:hypothetical protein
LRVVVTERGGVALGESVRTPRGLEPLGHELAVIKRVIAIERHFAEHGPSEARVLTERDMRRDQRRADGHAWSVEVIRERGRRGRWADYAVESPEGRTAVELEFSLKGTSRRRVPRGPIDRRRTRWQRLRADRRPRSGRVLPLGKPSAWGSER